MNQFSRKPISLNIINCLFVTLMVLILASTLSYYSTNYQTIRKIGDYSSYIAILLSFLGSIYCAIKYGIPKQIIFPLIICLTIIIRQIIDTIYHQEGFITIIQYCYIVAIILIFYNIGNTPSNVKISFLRILCFTYLTFIFITTFLIDGVYSISKQSYFGNPNSLGIFIISIYPILLITTKQNKYPIIFIICLILIIASASRTSLLAFICFNIVYLNKRILFSNKFFILLLFLTLNFASIFIIYFITSYTQADANAFVANKPILSGRENLWPLAIDLIMEKPLWGWGAGKSLPDLSTAIQNSHNQYLNILLQYGVIGFLQFSAFIYVISFLIYQNGKSRVGNIGIASITSMLVVMNFEDSYFQSTLLITLPLWCIIGLALNSRAC